MCRSSPSANPGISRPAARAATLGSPAGRLAAVVAQVTAPELAFDRDLEHALVVDEFDCPEGQGNRRVGLFRALGKRRGDALVIERGSLLERCRVEQHELVAARRDTNRK